MTPYRWHLAFLLVAAIAVPSFADTPIVTENFDDYVDDAAFYASWESSNFSNDAILTADDILYPGHQGQVVDHLGGSVNTWIESPFSLMPSETESVVYGGDIGDQFNIDGNPISGNKRLSIGLRYSGAENLVELGYWNANIVTPPTDPSENGFVGYAYRTILFQSGSSNWKFFVLDSGFDRPDDNDEIVGPGDIQPYANTYGLEVWHHWEATITPETVTLTLDLFRDGLTNNPTDNALSVEGVDATVVVDAVAWGSGFDSLRIGGPSSVTSPQPGGFDNVYLMLKDIIDEFDADFTGDGKVDGDDYLIWQGNFPNSSGTATKAMGDATGDGNVLGDDFLIWQGEFPSPGQGSASGAVPEPNSVALAALVLLGLAGIRGRLG